MADKLVDLVLNQLLGMVSLKFVTPGFVCLKNHCNHAVVAMLYSSVSAESRGNFFLCRNCKLLGTTIGRRIYRTAERQLY